MRTVRFPTYLMRNKLSSRNKHLRRADVNTRQNFSLDKPPLGGERLKGKERDTAYAMLALDFLVEEEPNEGPLITQKIF